MAGPGLAEPALIRSLTFRTNCNDILLKNTLLHALKLPLSKIRAVHQEKRQNRGRMRGGKIFETLTGGSVMLGIIKYYNTRITELLPPDPGVWIRPRAGFGIGSSPVENIVVAARASS